jgi:hypothetical protein
VTFKCFICKTFVSIATKRSGYYGVVQLAMLGSRYNIYNNHLVMSPSFVTSTWYSSLPRLHVFPTARVLSGQFPSLNANREDAPIPTVENITFHSRKNNLPLQKEGTLSCKSSCDASTLFAFQLGLASVLIFPGIFCLI